MSEVRFDFRDKVVIVTGVGRVGQIGHAAASAFGAAGARLVLCDLNAVAVAERAREFEAAGIAARPAAGDLTEPDVAQFAVQTALEQFGRLDTVVNIAGGLTTYGPIERTTLKDFDRELAINL
ncbi:MAG TPA: SDR family NAD(P)-dependent oxidoreductase, partial [Gemmatimonadales bacterium]|nr:SDR family NAD(P)-dependent oxidoreductase [Gemmatimonadales bacterium]